MNKVLIFTNGSSFEGFSDDVKAKIKLLGSYPDANHPIMWLDENEQLELKPVDNLNLEGVYLVYDDMDVSTITSLLRLCENDNLYVLTHTRGIEQKNILSLHLANCLALPGNHENNRKGKYKPVFDILGNESKKNKTECVIKEVFKPSMEKVLAFLNICFVSPSGKEFECLKKTILEKLPQESPVYKALADFPAHSDLNTISDLLISYVYYPN